MDSLGSLIPTVALVLVLAFATSNSSSSSSTSEEELHWWNSRMPQTRMPSEIKRLSGRDNNVPLNQSTPYVHEDWLHYSINGYMGGGSRGVGDVPNVVVGSLFLRETSLVLGTKLKLLVTNSSASRTPFLSRNKTEAIPFSSTKIEEVLNGLAIQPGSAVANITKQTLLECELPAIKGETKSCVSSLEAMVDFIASIIPLEKVQVLTTETSQDGGLNRPQLYFVHGLNRIASGLSITCHPRAYSFAVFFCHSAAPTRVYDAQMTGENGMQVSAKMMCHIDTSAWYPGHPAFKVLHLTPGSGVICHLVTLGHLVWV